MQETTTKEEAMAVAEEARAFEYQKPSFGAQLFMGHFDESMLLPFPKQAADDAKESDNYSKKIEELLKSYLDPDLVDTTREIPKAVIEQLAKVGAFAMKVPKKYGGLGLSQMTYNKTIMKVASYCGSTAVLLSAHQSIGVPQPLKLYGTEEQKQKYFPRFREGAISAFALTEPDVGSDPARMTTTATLSEDGSHYTLNGTKLWCTNGTVADIIIVIARTADKMVKGKPKRQITAFILEMDRPGVEVTHRCEFMGLNGIYNGVLTFDNVKIPVSDRLGDEGRGLAMALDTINVGRLTLPAASTGVAKQCLRIARIWGNERVQWGKPIGQHEAGREKIAYIASTTLAIEAVTHLTSLWADHGTCDLRIEAAMAKMFVTEELWKIVDATLQLRGGRGYEKAQSLKARGEVGFPVERMLRDCRINMILEGSTEIMKLFLAREAMEPHLKRLMPLIKGEVKGSALLLLLIKLFGFYSVWYLKQLFKPFIPKAFKEAGPLAKHFRYIDRTSHRLARLIFSYMARYQQKLENRQMILGRLIDIGTNLFVMAATAAYALSLNKEESVELADYFCTITRERTERAFQALKSNSDRKMNEVAKDVLEGDAEWLEKGAIF